MLVKLWLEFDTGFGLYDEGGLWYGIWQTSEGAVALRDFLIYDPGRYWWGGAIVRWLGADPFAFALSGAAFGLLGIAAGICVARRLSSTIVWQVFVGLILVVWMYPGYKSYDSGISLITLLLAVRLLEDPTWHRYLAAGVGVGLAAIVGRNHGVYALACILAVFVLNLHRNGFSESRQLLHLGAGMLVGYSPIFWSILYIPGFGDAWLDSIRRILEAGKTQHSLPIDWPWTVLDRSLPMLGTIATLRSVDFIKAVFYILIVLIPVSGAVVAWRSRHRRRSTAEGVFVASAILTAIYAHYVLSRADIDHFATGNKALLIALLAAPFVVPLRWQRTVGVILSVGLASATFYGAARLSPAYKRLVIAPAGYWQTAELLHRPIWVAPKSRRQIEVAKHVAGLMEEKESVAVFPNLPGTYLVLDRAAPVVDLYTVGHLTLTPERQEKLVDELTREAVTWVIWENNNFAQDLGTLKSGIMVDYVPVCSWWDLGWELLRARSLRGGESSTYACEPEAGPQSGEVVAEP